MSEHIEPSGPEQDEKKKAQDQRLDAIGWGLFLIMIGGVWLAPEGSVPKGAWLIGTGIIILGLMGVRGLYGIRINKFWLVLGVLALAFGASAVYGVNIPVLPILIVLIGLSIVHKSLTQKKA
jgi:hypothetical protein